MLERERTYSNLRKGARRTGLYTINYNQDFQRGRTHMDDDEPFSHQKITSIISIIYEYIRKTYLSNIESKFWYPVDETCLKKTLARLW